ncbi:MAG TPA: NAD-dependent epimerase/dehydratase family protein [Armatimonadota bacterium]|jgi:nucleoside-diphosphate-sugar epimerase|nr:NAD-dependent epimerase/dehydratase family protein [Armatimonadota bacterium]HPO74620.1 NAD-dependent epimerase/dehydratase family protein [Armatimonadota bacterium]
MRVLIIGGTGAFSGRVTERVVAAGHEVMLYNRGQRPLPDGVAVPVIRGERSALRDHAGEIAEFAPEAVIDSICFQPEEAADLVALFPQARRVVFISSVDAYGEDIGGAPVTEEREPRPVTDYGKGKLACERLLLEQLGDAVTVFRPSHILGRGFLTTSLWSRSPYLVDRVRKGKPVPAIDGGRNLMTPVYAGDIAEWVARSLESPAANGEVFNAVGPEIITQRRYYEIIAEILGVPIRLVAVPSHLFRQRFASPPQFNWHRPYSCAKVTSALGHAPAVGPEAMLRETVEYMMAHGLVRDCSEDPFDDRLVELLLRHEAELDALFAQKAG